MFLKDSWENTGTGYKTSSLYDLLTNEDQKLIKITLYARNNNGDLVNLSDMLRDIEDLDFDTVNDYPIYFSSLHNNESVDEFLANGYQRGTTPYVVWNKHFSGNLVMSIDVEVIENFNLGIETSKDPVSGDITITFLPTVNDYHNDLWTNGVYKTDNNLSVTPTAGYDKQFKGGISVKINDNDELYFDCNGDNSVTIKASDYDNDPILSYVITPYMYCGKLNSLAVSGSIDLSKVNSGVYDIIKWRYYNENIDSSLVTTLDWGVDYYPKNGCSIESVLFRFTDLLDPTYQQITIDATAGDKMGVFTQSFDGDLKPNTIYMCEVVIKEIDESGNYIERNDNISRVKYINTSEMYNGLYLDYSIKDYTVLDPLSSVNAVCTINPVLVSEEQKNDPLNVYATADGSMQKLYGVSYTDAKWNLQTTWLLNPSYKLFSIEEKNPIQTIVASTKNMYDYKIGCNNTINANFIGVSIDDAVYDNESDIDTNNNNPDQRRLIWDDLWSISDNLYGYFVHCPITTDAGDDGLQSKKTLYVENIIASLTSDYFADSIWGSRTLGTNKKKTVKWGSVVGNPMYNNEYFPGSYLIYTTLGKHQGENESNKTGYSSCHFVTLNKDVAFDVPASQGQVPMNINQTNKNFNEASEITKYAQTNDYTIWCPAVYHGLPSTYSFAAEKRYESTFATLKSNGTYPAASLLITFPAQRINAGMDHDADELYDIDGVSKNNYARYLTSGINTADATITTPFVLMNPEMGLRLWYGNYMPRINNGSFLTLGVQYELLLMVQNEKYKDYDLDSRDICFFIFHKGNAAKADNIVADCNVFSTGQRYYEAKEKKGVPMYNMYATFQDIVAAPPFYPDRIGAKLAKENVMQENQMSRMKAATITTGIFIRGFLAATAMVSMFLSRRENNTPALYGNYSYTRFSHVDTNAVQGKPILKLFSKVYGSQKYGQTKQFNIQSSITYDESYKLDTVFISDIKNRSDIICDISWNRFDRPLSLYNDVIASIEKNKDIIYDGKSYQYYTSDDYDPDKSKVSQNNIIIKEKDVSCDNKNLIVVNNTSKITTLPPDSNKLVQLFDMDDFDCIYIDDETDSVYTVDSNGEALKTGEFYGFSKDIPNGTTSGFGLVILDEMNKVEHTETFTAADYVCANSFNMTRKANYKLQNSDYRGDKDLNRMLDNFNAMTETSYNTTRKITIKFNPKYWKLTPSSTIADHPYTIMVTDAIDERKAGMLSINSIKAGKNRDDKKSERAISNTGWCSSGGVCTRYDYNNESMSLYSNDVTMLGHGEYWLEPFSHPDPEKSFIQTYDLFETEELTGTI